MIRDGEIASIMAVRRLREERAQRAMAAETLRLQAHEAAVVDVGRRIRAHDLAAAAQDAALGRRLRQAPVSLAQLRDARGDLARLDEDKADLVQRLREAEAAVAASRSNIERLRRQWVEALRAAERAGHMLSDQRTKRAAEAEWAEEGEREDSVTLREVGRC